MKLVIDKSKRPPPEKVESLPETFSRHDPQFCAPGFKGWIKVALPPGGGCFYHENSDRSKDVFYLPYGGEVTLCYGGIFPEIYEFEDGAIELAYVGRVRHGKWVN